MHWTLNALFNTGLMGKILELSASPFVNGKEQKKDHVFFFFF